MLIRKFVNIKLPFYITVFIILTSCAALIIPINVFAKDEADYTTRSSSKHTIVDAVINEIRTPKAGNYPSSLFKYPSGAGDNKFIQTLEWKPAVTSTFKTNTVYTATLTLKPSSTSSTFKGVSLDDIKGLPDSRSVTYIKSETVIDSIVITIEFPKTLSEETEPELWFFDDFTGTKLDKTKWDYCPNWQRQGRSTWRDNQVRVENETLILSFEKSPSSAPESVKGTDTADNWIKAGAVRTRKKNGDAPIIFENSYGYYEASIKFPKVSGMWGAFWLMSVNQIHNPDNGAYATEIDIVETIANPVNGFNGALNWNGYESDTREALGSGDITARKLGFDIYDGEFHTFALDWSPVSYIWYVDGVEFFRYTTASNISRNPDYIKLSIEGSAWSPNLSADTGEMIVDYVKVYSQPKKEVE